MIEYKKLTTDDKRSILLAYANEKIQADRRHEIEWLLGGHPDWVDLWFLDDDEIEVAFERAFNPEGSHTITGMDIDVVNRVWRAVGTDANGAVIGIGVGKTRSLALADLRAAVLETQEHMAKQAVYVPDDIGADYEVGPCPDDPANPDEA